MTRVHATNSYHWLINTITKIELPPANQGGPPIVYELFYDEIHVSRSCKDTHSETGPRILLPHLKRIDLPDGTSWSMKEGSDLLYENICNPTDDAPGALTGLIMPTGAKLEWQWQQVNFPAPSGDELSQNGAGVKYRRLYDRLGAEAGEWRYQFNKALNAGGTDEHEMRSHLVYPTGHCTKNYFDARYKISVSQKKGWRFGLPGGQSESVDLDGNPRYIASKIYSSNNGSGSCSGTKLRSNYVEHRPRPATGFCRQSRRLAQLEPGPSSDPNCLPRRWRPLDRYDTLLLRRSRTFPSQRKSR